MLRPSSNSLTRRKHAILPSDEYQQSKSIPINVIFFLHQILEEDIFCRPNVGQPDRICPNIPTNICGKSWPQNLPILMATITPAWLALSQNIQLCHTLLLKHPQCWLWALHVCLLVINASCWSNINITRNNFCIWNLKKKLRETIKIDNIIPAKHWNQTSIKTHNSIFRYVNVPIVNTIETEALGQCKWT